MRRIAAIAIVLMTFFISATFAAKVTLKDGTILAGEVKKLGGSYSIKGADGAMKLVSAGDVASIDDPTGKIADPATPAKATPSSGAGAARPSGGGASADFAVTQRQAERADSPIVAVTLWQKYIDEHTGSPDIEQAKAELARWQKMAKDGAEKIKGKWVTGEELKAVHETVQSLLTDAAKNLSGKSTVKGIENLQDVIKIYPESFEAHFELGYFYLVSGGNTQYDKAINSLETASRLRPNSAAALSNLGIAYNFRRNFEKAVTTSFKAAEIDDRPEIVQNLVNTISYAPPGMRANNPTVRPIIEKARAMMATRGISGPSPNFAYVRPKPMEEARGEGKGTPRNGIVGSGTGFFITADGYILTNRHVAKAADGLIIRMSDGTQKVAEKILIDDKQDIAILKIKSDKPTPMIHLAPYAAPPVGTDVTVMGFPLGASLGTGVKITRGVVTSVEDSGPDCDVIVDAQVNPGNSGGPMIDKHGNLMALVAMKTFADEKVSSYGLGISTGRLRTFFDGQKDKLPFKLPPAEAKATPMSTEDIAGKYKPATVMILMFAGDLPADLKGE